MAEEFKDMLDFMQKMWNPLGFAAPGMMQPTVDPAELEKRIAELRTIENWLKMNQGFLQMTIKTLEMQKSALDAFSATAGADAEGVSTVASAVRPGRVGPHCARLVRDVLLPWLCVAAALLPAAPARAVEDVLPGVAASYMVVRGGEPLWGHAVDARLPPASLTKLMTALLVLERNRPSEVVTVGAAARETGSRIGLRQGDRLRAGDLLAAAVVRSANDACRALADHVGGSTERFVAMMNRRAQALDLTATRYADPCGHDRAGHVTSAADLARLGAAVAEHPEYLRLAQAWDMRITTVDGRRTYSLDNTNALIGRYPGAIGLKTGYTRRAGRCLVALAERDGVRVLVVLLNAPDRWESAVSLLDRAFAERGR